ncbi:hypothetical protein CONCODRAFT_8949 [Conidiobolus coronatus NRRL 28638]|uniref:Uncharacterized protein n=1 Tax=Conidiobolus coronatus (strain ATCC 28846 / CBS 209.66 / NRRL 28638) TaxID=796925 RepID=A0A137P1I4_CONC2|nr:hypothetical protein CONCODRAFT_8949 [Conidiobolus coronatus NRRL 28638]|eukprot:KXN68739.1 hypothetical protein CONCODRAFT_8949 [Conidiobolus coronatus NRRL 28638]
MFEGTLQYIITQPKSCKNTWDIKSSENNETVLKLKLKAFKTSKLIDTSGNTLGTVELKRFLTSKRELTVIDLCNDLKITCTWFSLFKFPSFEITGNSNVDGYSKINWKLKREGFNNKLILEDLENGQCLAEFSRHHPSIKEIGTLIIFPKLDNNLNLMIFLVCCYSFRHILIEERSHLCWR